MKIHHKGHEEREGEKMDSDPFNQMLAANAPTASGDSF